LAKNKIKHKLTIEKKLITSNIKGGFKGNESSTQLLPLCSSN